MIEHLAEIAAGVVVYRLGVFAWRLAFPRPGRCLLVIRPGVDIDDASIVVDGKATELVVALSTALGKHLLERPVAEWPAAVAVEVMPRP